MSNKRMHLNALPTEVKLHIMSFLNRKELATARQVCSEWNILAQDKSLPALQVPDYDNASEPTVIGNKILDMTTSDDGRYLAILSAERENNLSLIDTENNATKLQMTVDPHLDASSIKLALTPDNKHLIITYHRGKDLFSFNQSQYNLINIYDLENKKIICRYDDLNIHKNIPPVPFVQVISNERFLVSFAPFKDWDIRENRYKNIYLCDIHTPNARLVDSDYMDVLFRHYGASCISPNKELFARIIDNSINIHLAETGMKIKSINLPSNYDLRTLTNIEFLNDNKTLCLITGELAETDAGSVYRKAPQNPFVVKIDCNDHHKSKWEFCKNKPEEFDDRFALLPNNYLAVFGQKNNTTPKITILDLNSEERVKDISIAAKKIVTNKNGSKMFVLTEGGKLNMITIPFIYDLKLEQQERSLKL